MVPSASPRPRRSCASSRPPGHRELRRRPRGHPRASSPARWRRARPRRSRHCSAPAAATRARARVGGRARGGRRRGGARRGGADAVGARARARRGARRRRLRDCHGGRRGGGVRGRRGPARLSRRRNEDNKGLAATKTSAFGAVAPVAARAAGASSRDVTCVPPASRPGARAARVRRAAVTAPPSPRARAARRGRRGFVPRRSRGPRDGGDAFSFARRSLGTRALRARRRLGLASGASRTAPPARRRARWRRGPVEVTLCSWTRRGERRARTLLARTRARTRLFLSRKAQ